MVYYWLLFVYWLSKIMFDSSEDENLSRFREAVDTSFTKLIEQAKNGSKAAPENGNNEHFKKSTLDNKKPKSERYLEIASHYNDIKVPEEMQKRIGAKLSAVIAKNIEFVESQQNGVKKRKIKGGVKLFTNSSEFLSCDAVQDTYTENHNKISSKIKRKRRQIDEGMDVSEDDKIHAVAITGEHILAKEETKCWKSRRKEKLFQYKSNGKTKVLTAVE